VIHLLLVRLRDNWLRVTALVLGIAAATTAFVVLTGQVAVQRLELRGHSDTRSAPNYDILVRPAGSRTDLENSQGLVRANFLSGQFGGITLAQWHRIQQLAGVQVAAPIAMVGYVLQSVTIPIDITDQLSSADQQLFTASVRRRSGLSEFRQPAISYSYVSAAAVSKVGMPNDPETTGFAVAQRHGPPRLVCPLRPKATGSPFAIRSQRNGSCWSRVNGPDGAGFTLLPRGHVGILVQWTFPFLLAAVDPVQEAELVGLDQAVSRGGYLPEHGPAPGRDRHSVPVLMAEHTGLDDVDEVSVQRLSAAATAEFGRGLSTARLDALLDSQHGPVVATASITAETAYQRLLEASLQAPFDPVVDSYWTSGPVRYDTEPDGSLRPRRVQNPASNWTAPLNMRGYVAVPPDTADTAFRRLSKHELLAASESSDGAGPRLATIGVFDESRLEEGSGQGSGQALLGGYRTEPLTPADRASGALLHDGPLLPGSNIAGYLLPAPTMLTSLDAASVFTDSAVFDNVSGAAPISAVKVRVAGAHGTDAVSRERVRLVAEAVAAATGLDVDVTVGSSPAARRIVLPAGSAGRPQLELAEQWQRKGVVVVVRPVLDRKSLLLFVLVLVVCGIFIANATVAAARSPRMELSTLSCLGWTRGQLMRLLLGEMVVIGAAAGIAGALVSLVAAEALRVPVSPGRALAAAPAALVVTVLAAAWPAWRASLPSPIPDSPATEWGRPVRGRLKGVRGPLQLAYLNLRAEPARTGLGMVAVGVGSAGLTLLLAVTVTFRGTVVGTLLGDVVSLQTRRVDYLAVVLTLLLAAIAVADVGYLNVRERRDDLALLRAVGWTDRRLGQLITFEGVLIGLAGSAIGSGLGLAVAAVLADSVPGSLWLLAGLTVLAGAVISALASLLAALSLPLLVRTPSLTRD
jgi:hypothetical protein